MVDVTWWPFLRSFDVVEEVEYDSEKDEPAHHYGERQKVKEAQVENLIPLLPNDVRVYVVAQDPQLAQIQSHYGGNGAHQ